MWFYQSKEAQHTAEKKIISVEKYEKMESNLTIRRGPQSLRSCSVFFLNTDTELLDAKLTELACANGTIARFVVDFALFELLDLEDFDDLKEMDILPKINPKWINDFSSPQVL